jgi:hypothetical protein|tara:strand:+ start:155 stop:934 length:780 start_codon:yes stop_codon:yes gene_type:complete
LEPKGYLIVAQGNQYHQCARTLAKSIKYFMPTAKIAVVGDCKDPIFDYEITFNNPESGMRNDWQIFKLTPFHETIKLEADMILNGSIEHWWNEFQKKDVVVVTGTRNFYNEQTSVRHYRKHFDKNYLPDVYNAVTYWRKSKLALDFSAVVKALFMNWQEVSTELKEWQVEDPDTDTVYALAISILGEELLTLPHGPQFVHMKGKINNCKQEDWTKELVWELTDQGLRINTIQQTIPTHYFIKDFSSILEKHYDKLLESS